LRKRIYSSFILLILPCALILSALLSLLYHNAAKTQELASVRDHARLVSDLLSSGVTGDILFSDYSALNAGSTRITVVAPDGKVLLDSRAAADRMENHAGRPEIIEALESGTGESLRYSATLRTDMYYYAVRMGDGNILRVSKAVGGLADVFAVALPVAAAVTALVLVLAGLTARRLTKRVIAPLSSIDFDSAGTVAYEELQPYLEKIDRQKTEINEKMAQLSERADTINAITSNMKEGMIIVSSDAAVLSANNSAREVFGENIERKNIMHLCRDTDFQSAVKKCLSGENEEIQLHLAGRIYSVYLSPVYSNGQTRGALILFQDATERSRAEKQRREFSANVSHELKTPLTTISALSEMIENGIAKEDDIKSFAARISEQSGRLLMLIDDIIRLSEFDEGGADKEGALFDLWELAQTVIGEFRDNPGGVELKLTGERFEISANRRMIDELLHNLIDNGVKYNKDGGSVTVDLSLVEASKAGSVNTSDEAGTGEAGTESTAGAGEDRGTVGQFCRISVTDTGIGIPAQHQSRVFERFYRVEGSRSKKTGGTGLGLSIVKHITEAHGGWLELESTEGGGTAVTCFIKK